MTYYRVNGLHWFSELDDLDNGCDPATTTSEFIPASEVFEGELVGESLEELIAGILSYIYGGFVPNPGQESHGLELDACDELGRLDIEVMQDWPNGSVYGPGEVQAALEAQTAARVSARLTGEHSPKEQSVWLTVYTAYVERVTVETGLSLQELHDKEKRGREILAEVKAHKWASVSVACSQS